MHTQLMLWLKIIIEISVHVTSNDIERINTQYKQKCTIISHIDLYIYISKCRFRLLFLEANSEERRPDQCSVAVNPESS